MPVPRPPHPPSSGRKFDDGKVRWDLLPFAAVEEVLRVLGHGAKKYGPHNWRDGIAFSRLSAAALRHVSAWCQGRDCDPETGCYHLAHAVCELLFILELQLHGRDDLDDRWRPPSAPSAPSAPPSTAGDLDAPRGPDYAASAGEGSDGAR
jgi:hypothetical protein